MNQRGNGCLDSWKEVADYLGRDISTVLRWQRRKGLPVHRVPGGKRHAVFAFKEEIDRWMLGAGVRDGNSGTGESDFEARKVSDAFFSLTKTETQTASPLPVPANPETRITNPQLFAANPETQTPVSVPEKAGFRWKFYAAALAVVLGTIGIAYLLARSTLKPQILGYTQLTHDGRRKQDRLVSDGARLYFVENLESGQAIVQIPISGGEPQVVSAAFRRPSIEDLSRHRGEMLVLDPAGIPGVASPLWALSLTGGMARRVGHVLATAAVYSPDGSRIAYGSNGGLYLSRPDGADARNAVAIEGRLQRILWSPDGRILRMTAFRGEGLDEFWEVSPDGSNLRPVLGDWRVGPGDLQIIGWTPDGADFLMASEGIAGRKDLWAQRENHLSRWFHGGRAQLSAGPLSLTDAVSSPDGHKAYVLASRTQHELLRLDPVRGKFVRYFTGLSANEVAYSVKGQWLAYIGSPDLALWKRRADGSQATRMTSSPMQIELPRWSPDGKWIAFMGHSGFGDPWQVYVVPVDGGACQRVWPSSISQGAPTWSPDGREIMLGELAGSPGKDPKDMVIRLVGWESGKATVLDGSQGLWSARWSLDGKFAAAITADSKSLMLYDFAGRKWCQLASAGRITDLNWSHQGSWLYFEDLVPPNGPAIFRVQIYDRKIEKVASLGGAIAIASDWFALTPDDAILVSNGVGGAEIYALDWELP